MAKISCDVIKDLLPLYQDEVCSEDSQLLVEEHVQACSECQKELEELKAELDCPHIKMDEAKPIQAIAATWKKDKVKSYLKGALITAIVCIMTYGCYYGLTRWKVIPVSSELLQVSEVSQLSDGRIIYHLNVMDNKDLYFVKFTTTEDGRYYMTPMRSVIEDERTMEVGLFNDYFMVDVAENNAYQQNFGDGIEITSVYLGTEEDSILIWEKGMELPKASKELERMVFGNK